MGVSASGRRAWGVGAIVVAALLSGGMLAGCAGGANSSVSAKEGAAAGAAMGSSNPGQSQGSSPVATQAVPAAFSRTAAVSSLSFSMQERATVAGQEFTITGTGTQDLRANSLQSTLTLPQRGAVSGEVEARLVAGTLYMKIPALASRLPGNKQWLSISGDSDSEFGSLAQAMDAGQQLKDFTKVLGGTVTEVGTQDIRGVATTHYQVSVDTEKLLQLGSLAAGGIPVPAATGTTTMDVFVGPDGYLRELDVDVAIASSPVTITVQYFDFNRPVHISAPPADEVASAHGLLP